MANLDNDYIEQIKNAAYEGALNGTKKALGRKPSIGKTLYRVLGFIALIAFIIVGILVVQKITKFSEKISSSFEREAPIESHDMVLEDDGILGFTVADFEEVILGNPERLKKIEVLKREASELTTITDTGLIKRKIFSKTQCITYHGIAIYTIDLSTIGNRSIEFNEDEKKVLLYIPHAELEQPINIPSDQIEFGEINKGLLSFGKLDITPEEMAEVQTEARTRMETKLKNENTQEEADRLAKLTVWEIFQPLINQTAPGYVLEVIIE